MRFESSSLCMKLQTYSEWTSHALRLTEASLFPGLYYPENCYSVERRSAEVVPIIQVKTEPSEWKRRKWVEFFLRQRAKCVQRVLYLRKGRMLQENLDNFRTLIASLNSRPPSIPLSLGLATVLPGGVFRVKELWLRVLTFELVTSNVSYEAALNSSLSRQRKIPRSEVKSFLELLPKRLGLDFQWLSNSSTFFALWIDFLKVMKAPTTYPFSEQDSDSDFVSSSSPVHRNWLGIALVSRLVKAVRIPFSNRSIIRSRSWGCEAAKEELIPVLDMRIRITKVQEDKKEKRNGRLHMKGYRRKAFSYPNTTLWKPRIEESGKEASLARMSSCHESKFQKPKERFGDKKKIQVGLVRAFAKVTEWVSLLADDLPQSLAKLAPTLLLLVPEGTFYRPVYLLCGEGKATLSESKPWLGLARDYGYLDLPALLDYLTMHLNEVTFLPSTLHSSIFIDQKKNKGECGILSHPILFQLRKQEKSPPPHKDKLLQVQGVINCEKSVIKNPLSDKRRKAGQSLPGTRIEGDGLASGSEGEKLKTLHAVRKARYDENLSEEIKNEAEIDDIPKVRRRRDSFENWVEVQLDCRGESTGRKKEEEAPFSIKVFPPESASEYGQDDQSESAERRESGKNLSHLVTKKSDDSSITQGDPTLAGGEGKGEATRVENVANAESSSWSAFGIVPKISIGGLDILHFISSIFQYWAYPINPKDTLSLLSVD
ncbi:hypothetical protein H5410_050485 [Solanum commersonii]|uniref:Uncharacterized protein n=1 Tax=Solanum commersonii TaxID=4109 RepID=A0A9J5WVN3_SOLCO|nr:hypothetical protein H5410_050485 [Solanum commersonii]